MERRHTLIQSGFAIPVKAALYSTAVPKLFGCWAKFATLSVSAGQTALCIEKNKTKIHTHNIGHVCTLHFFCAWLHACNVTSARASFVA